MSVTLRRPEARGPVTRPLGRGGLITMVTGGLGLLMLALGGWSFANPGSFAAFTRFAEHTHYLHDIGAFQIGIGITLLLALMWEDSLAVALGGFFTGNTLHVVSHVMDLGLGGRPTDWLFLSIVSIVALVALLARLRQLRANLAP